MIGRQVGDYQIIGQLGTDAFGVVYHALSERNGWNVALRHFPPELTDQAVIKTYTDTALGAMKAQHPCVLHVVETVWSGRNAFLASELVEGETLAQALQRDRRLWPELTVKIGWQLAQTLAATQGVGVPHLALRPDGVYVAPDTAWPGGFRTKIVDFGCHAFLGGGGGGAPDWRSARVEALGLPFYLSPEQCRGAAGDARSDVYSLGCVIYHLACGRPPFMGQSPYDLATAHQHTQAQPPEAYEHSVHLEVSNLAMAMIAKEPSARPTMAMVVGELERIAHLFWPAQAAMKTVSQQAHFGAPGAAAGGAGKRRKWWVVGAVVAALAGGGVAVALAVRPSGKVSGGDGGVSGADLPLCAPGTSGAAGPSGDGGACRPAADTAGGMNIHSADAGAAGRLEGHLAEARRLLAAEKPDEALVHAKAAAKLAPKDAEAARLIALAKAEPQNRKLYEAFSAAVGKHDAPRAAATYAKIPLESVYREKATADLDKLRAAWVHDREEKAHGLAAAHACARIDAVIKEVKAVFPESAAPIEAAKRSCTLK